MIRSIRSVASLCLLISTTLFAAERVQLDEKPGERRVRPLLIALPSLETNDQSLVEIRILRGRERVIQQTLMIPPGTPEGAVIDVLFTHPTELRQLREEAANLQVIVRANGRLIIDEPFVAIDARGSRLSPADAIGDLREVKTYPKLAKRVAAQGMYYDPYCMDYCDTQYNSCLQWCDPRGDSCTQCEIWYHDCYTQCPILCEDPKNVSTYTVQTPVSYTQILTQCVRNYQGPAEIGHTWIQYSTVIRTDTYQRTEYCNGSYTDTLTSTSYNTITCWKPTTQLCAHPPGFGYGYNICP